MNKKSPRDYLLARHTAAAPQLDALRQSVLSSLTRHAAEDAPVPTSQLLRALFLPHRRLWAALAATWLLLATIHFSQRPSPSATPTQLATEKSTLTRSELAAHPDWFANRQAQLHALLR